MISVGDFLAGFPEFSAVPEATVNYWITQAYNQLNATLLGTQIDYAAALYTAHNLVPAKKALDALKTGAAIGDAISPVQTKTVGGVTVTFDTASAAIEGAGQWNSTRYGQLLYPLIRGASLGGIYTKPWRSGHSYSRGARGLMGW